MKTNQNFTINWTLINGIFWAFGFIAGLVLGFFFPVIGDTFAVIIFIGLVFYFQKYLLKQNVDWADPFIKTSIPGFIIGLTIGFIFTLFTDVALGLDISHLFAFAITLIVTAYFQYRELKKHYSNAYIWIIHNGLALLVGLVSILAIDNFVDLRLDLLNVRQTDYSATIPWGFTGLFLGLIYGGFTSLALKQLKEIN